MTGTRWLRQLLANFSLEVKQQQGESSSKEHSALDDKLLVDSGSLSCPICYVTFSEAPRVLPCGHSMCLDCLRGLAASRCSAARECLCPLCRTSYRAYELPKNFAVESVLDAIVDEVAAFCKQHEKELNEHKSGADGKATEVSKASCDPSQKADVSRSKSDSQVPASSQKQKQAVKRKRGDECKDESNDEIAMQTFVQSNAMFDYNRLKLRVEAMDRKLRAVKKNEQELRSMKFRELTFRELKEENRCQKATINGLQLLVMLLIALCVYLMARYSG